MSINIFSKYYHQYLKTFFKQIVPRGSRVLLIKENGKVKKGKCDYILLKNSFAYANDVQDLIKRLGKNCHPNTKIVVIYYNFLWKPILNLATFLGLRKKDLKEPSWFSMHDVYNLFTIEGFDEISRSKKILLPINLGILSKIINQYISQLPLINNFCLVTCQIFRKIPDKKCYSTSIIVPAKNEKGNIKRIINEISIVGKRTEIIFIEGHSKDNTYQTIKSEIARNKRKNLRMYLYKQGGEGKADAVRLGFKKAENDILMILDADLSVSPKDLHKFYKALSEGYCEFANGSRLVYPMQKQAMRNLNYLGNKLFSWAFSYLLDQPIKDTLCGTKALFKKDYLTIEKNRKFFGDFDPFGDFDLLFGASKANLKIVEIPVRYSERTYGKTNISRFAHGWLLLKMTLIAAKKIKFA